MCILRLWRCWTDRWTLRSWSRVCPEFEYVLSDVETEYIIDQYKHVLRPSLESYRPGLLRLVDDVNLLLIRFLAMYSDLRAKLAMRPVLFEMGNKLYAVYVRKMRQAVRTRLRQWGNHTSSRVFVMIPGVLLVQKQRLRGVCTRHIGGRSGK